MIDTAKLIELVNDPMYYLKFYHGDVKADLIAVLETYSDADNLAEQLDDAECTISWLKDDITDLSDEIKDLKTTIEKLENEDK